MVKCSNEDCAKHGIHLCSKCGNAQYCSKECQVGHWSTHSGSCFQRTAENLISVESLTIKQLKYLLRCKAAALSSSDAVRLKEKEADVVEKVPLVRLVEASLTQTEMLEFLAAFRPDKAPSPVVPKKKKQVDTQLEDLKRATPAQLREQARVFRQDPDRVRRAQPSLAHMSNAELVSSAEQMERMAADPAILRETIEMMEKLTPAEREMATNMSPEQRQAIESLTPAQKANVQKIQALSAEQRASIMAFQRGLSESIDEAWATAVVTLMRNKGEAFKMMAKSMFELQDEQIDSWVDMVSSMDEWSIRTICWGLGWLQRLGKPALRGYEAMNKATYGMGRHIVLLVLGVALYLALTWAWWAAKLAYSGLFALLVRSKVFAPSQPASAALPKEPLAAATEKDAAQEWARNNGVSDEFDF